MTRRARNQRSAKPQVTAPESAAKSIDLSMFEDLQRIQDEGKFFPIFDQAGRLSDMRVKVNGPDSDAQRDANREAARDLRGIREREFRDPTDEEVLAANRKVLKAAVMEWENVVWKGEPFPCTPENVEKLLATFPVFSDQVAGYSTTRALFMPSEA